MKNVRRLTLAVLLLALMMLLPGGCIRLPARTPVPMPDTPVTEVNEVGDTTPGSEDYEVDPEPVARTKPEPKTKPEAKVKEPEDNLTKPEAKKPPKSTALAGVTVDEQVLLDHAGIKITLRSLDLDNDYGPSFKILVENNSDKRITVHTQNESINGIMINSSLYVSVEPGKKANDEMEIYNHVMERAGIETIAEVELMFRITDADTYSEIYTSEFISIKTSAFGSYTQVYDDSGTLLFNENGLKFAVKGLDSDIDDSYWGARVLVYMENTGDRDLSVSMKDVSVNGYMIDPYYSCSILSGKRAYDAIGFWRSHFDDNDIESIEELEFSLQITDIQSRRRVKETEKFVLKF